MKGYKVFLFGKLILLSSSFFDRKSIEERNIRIKCLEMACNLIVERNKIEEKNYLILRMFVMLHENFISVSNMIIMDLLKKIQISVNN